MENVDLTGKVKNFIRFGLIGLLAASGAIGYGMFQHYHADKILQIENAKVTSNTISVHALTNGKIKELLFADGDEVKAGDIVAKIEVNVTEEDIKKLQQNVDTAKKNYETLKLGQHVKTPVRRTKTVPSTTQPAAAPRTTANSASVSTLEERARRLEELYEMGAVSKGELDKARQDLSKAKSSSASSTPAITAAPSTTTVEIDYVDSIQPTPAAVLQSAENAVKEAEMALNAAVEQSQQTDIIAPADGIIYYSFLVDEEFKAGDVVAKIGDNKNVWIEAEVSEDIFNQVSLGKKVNYTLDGHNLSGILMEKIAPPKPEPVKEEAPAETPPESAETTPAENSAEQNTQAEKPAENPEKKVEQPAQTPPAETSETKPAAEENKSADASKPAEENKTEESPAEEKPAEETAEEEPEPEKYFIRVSIPDDRDFKLDLLAETTLKIIN